MYTDQSLLLALHAADDHPDGTFLHDQLQIACTLLCAIRTVRLSSSAALRLLDVQHDVPSKQGLPAASNNMSS